jgi:hypothetical protein
MNRCGRKGEKNIRKTHSRIAARRACKMDISESRANSGQLEKERIGYQWLSSWTDVATTRIQKTKIIENE